ncbi:hypothetical protein Droror1_Dr00015875 [Drosera rotundifolia]
MEMGLRRIEGFMEEMEKGCSERRWKREGAGKGIFDLGERETRGCSGDGNERRKGAGRRWKPVSIWAVGVEAASVET